MSEQVRGAQAPRTCDSVSLARIQVRRPAGSGRVCALARTAVLDVHVSCLLDLDLFLADLARDPLGILDHALADLDFLGHNRLLGDGNFFLADPNANLSYIADVT